MQLESIARSQSLPAALARRAQVNLPLPDGETNSAVARRYRSESPDGVAVAQALRRTRYRRMAQRPEAQSIAQHRGGLDRDADIYSADEEAERPVPRVDEMSQCRRLSAGSR